MGCGIGSRWWFSTRGSPSQERSDDRRGDRIGCVRCNGGMGDLEIGSGKWQMGSRNWAASGVEQKFYRWKEGIYVPNHSDRFYCSWHPACPGW